MQTLGQRLREEREKSGRSIEDLSRRTRIRSEYFVALESGHPERLPSPFFYRSFLRQYVALLGLPESLIQEEIQRSMEDEHAVAAERYALPDTQRPDLPPLPTGRTDYRGETKRWLMRLARLVAVLALCSGAYFAWLRWGQRFSISDLAAVWSAHKPSEQAELGHAQSQPAQPAAGPSAPGSAQPSSQPAVPSAETASPRPPSETAALPSGALQQPPSETGLPSPVSPPEPQKRESAPPAAVAAAAGSPEAAPVQGEDLVIQADAPCWVDGWRDGRHFYAALLRPGARAGFAAAGTLRLRFGDAGAVSVQFKGQPQPALGPRGQVRMIEIQNGEYRAIAPVVPAPKQPAAPDAVKPAEPAPLGQ